MFHIAFHTILFHYVRRYTFNRSSKLRKMVLNGVTVGDLQHPECAVWKYWDPAPQDWRDVTKIMWKTTKDYQESEGDDYVYPLPLADAQGDGGGDDGADPAFLSRSSRINEL